MNFELIAQFFLVMINAIGIILAWWVLMSGSERPLKQWFTLMTIFMLLWANFSYFGSRSGDLLLASNFYKLNWAAVSLFFPSFYYFYVIYFLKKGRNANKLGIVIVIVSLFLLFASLLTDWIIHGVIPRSWGMEIEFGPLGIFFNIFSVFVSVVVIRYSLQGYAKMADEGRSKLKFFLTGMFIFILANLVFNVGSQVLFQSVQYQIVGDFSSIFLLGFTAYATIQHKLFDVKVLATEALTVLLLIFLLARVVTSEDDTERLIGVFIFLLAVVFGYLLIQSVKREIEQKEKLRTLTEQLKELDAQKDEFLNVAAHELRAPMTAIKGYLSMLKTGDGGKIPIKAQDFLNEAAEENDRLIRLVNNLLDVSRIEEGRMTFEMGEVHLSKVVKTVFRQFEQEAKVKNLEYSINIEENINDLVVVDVDRIHEVVANLVSNAIKYTDKGSVRLNLYTKDSMVRFEVSDTGPGLSVEEQTKLFQKFSRAESSIGKKVGTGLGLFISRLLVEHFGGTISLSSLKDQGSTFWFELPMKKV